MASPRQIRHRHAHHCGCGVLGILSPACLDVCRSLDGFFRWRRDAARDSRTGSQLPGRDCRPVRADRLAICRSSATAARCAPHDARGDARTRVRSSAGRSEAVTIQALSIPAGRRQRTGAAVPAPSSSIGALIASPRAWCVGWCAPLLGRARGGTICRGGFVDPEPKFVRATMHELDCQETLQQ